MAYFLFNEILIFRMSLQVSIYEPAYRLHFQIVFLRIFQPCFYKQTTNSPTSQRRGDSCVRKDDGVATQAVGQLGNLRIEMYFKAILFSIVNNIEFIGLHVIFLFAFHAQ